MAREQSDLIPGTFDMLILKALSLGEIHGWGVAERIEREAGSRLPGLAATASSRLGCRAMARQ